MLPTNIKSSLDEVLIYLLQAPDADREEALGLIRRTMCVHCAGAQIMPPELKPCDCAGARAETERRR